MKLDELEGVVRGGESETLELKQSTGQLARAAETLCAFLNANGGIVVLGVTPQGKLVGQQVADKTQQELAQTLRKFEPPAPVTIKRIPIPIRNEKWLCSQRFRRAKHCRLCMTGDPTSASEPRRQSCRRSAISSFCSTASIVVAVGRLHLPLE